MQTYPAVVGSGLAVPPSHFPQAELCRHLCDLLASSATDVDAQTESTVGRVVELFRASRVGFRHLAVDPRDYYARVRTTGERMDDYVRLAHPLALAAVEAALDDAQEITPGCITDLILVSCTGYAAPGLDILVSRDLSLRADLRRTIIGHMGCYGAVVGLRDALQMCRSQPSAIVALLSVELSSLHYVPSRDSGAMTAMALFGDAAACVLLSSRDGAQRAQLIDAYCETDFTAMDQMTWNLTDRGFEMTLSWRVPVSLGRSVARTVVGLLSPHGLCAEDITHWLIHPGGPSILTAIQERLRLADHQLALSWQVLHDHGNCSSATVLLMLNSLLQSGASRSGEWGVMMAFGPGLTLETCLLRF